MAGKNETTKVGFFAKVGNFFKRIGKRLAKFWRDYVSEMKKVVWMPWKDVKKNTLLVVVTVVLCGIAIGIVDTAFSGAIEGLAGLVG